MKKKGIGYKIAFFIGQSVAVLFLIGTLFSVLLLIIKLLYWIITNV